MFKLRQRHQHVSGVYPSSHIILYYFNEDTGKIIFHSKFFANEDSSHTTKISRHINNNHTCG